MSNPSLQEAFSAADAPQALPPAASLHDGAASRPDTPADLADHGYRVEFGVLDDRGSACYWWSWTVPGCADVSVSCGEFDSADEAIADARRDLREWSQ